MKRFITILFRAFEILLVAASVMICIYYHLSGHDNLAFGMERITGITGYAFDQKRVELILHKSNLCDSIVMVQDHRPAETIRSQIESLVVNDDRWKRVHIPESEAYETIAGNFAGAMQTKQHFRPVCEIGNGCYDYMFLDVSDNAYHKNRYGCLIDVDTGTIALYIYLD